VPALRVPGGHKAHAVAASRAALYVPAGHGPHAGGPARRSGGGLARSRGAGPRRKKPALQSHASGPGPPAGDHESGPHAAHPDALVNPARSEYVPAAHGAQASGPAALLYVPGAHAVQGAGSAAARRAPPAGRAWKPALHLQSNAGQRGSKVVKRSKAATVAVARGCPRRTYGQIVIKKAARAVK
jgi:hypothetical protein